MEKLFLAKVFDKARLLCSQVAGGLLPLGPVLSNYVLKPSQINFETTNICNANCIFYGYRYLKRPKGMMPEEIFRKAIADFIDIGGGNIGFSPPVGDPLLDPSLLERIRYARSFREIKHIGLFTNGIAIDRFDTKEILLSGVNTIVISFDGFNRDSYLRIFGVDEYERVIRNISLLACTNDELARPVHITLALRVDKPLAEIIREPDFKKIAPLVDDIQYSYRFDNWGGRIQQKDFHGIMQIRKPTPRRGPCSIFYGGGPTIFSNGDVTICGCRDLDGDKAFRLGNIKTDSLISLWHSDTLESLRKNSYRGIMPAPCINCSHYNSVRLYAAFTPRRAAEENRTRFFGSRYYQRKGNV